MPNLSFPVPAALTILTSFGCQSGYKLKFNKCKLVLLSDAAKRIPLHDLSGSCPQQLFVSVSVQVEKGFEIRMFFFFYLFREQNF